MAAYTESMDDPAIDDILKDIHDSSQSVASRVEVIEQERNYTSLSVVDLDVVNQACAKLIADDCLPAEVHEICRSADRHKLLSCMQFLMTCLTVTEAYFKSSIKEKAWAKFHAAVADQHNMRPLDEIVTPNVSTWLCFATFEILLQNLGNCSTKSKILDSKSDYEFNGKDRAVTVYVGGAVVCKIKQKAYRLKNTEQKQDLLNLVEELTTTGGETESGCLTSLLDRGGLVKLHPNIELMFLNLEATFRGLFGEFSSTAMHFQDFFQKCLSLDAVSTRFHDHLYKVNVQETTKQKLFKDILFLYFKIRAHHKCKTFMDNFHCNTRKEKREKGLRKRLRQKKQIPNVDDTQ